MIGHNFSPEEIIDRVKEKWELKKWPQPRFKILCPVCNSDEVMIKKYAFSKREKGGVKHRCLVRYKCLSCSHDFEFGLPIPKSLYEKHVDRDVHSHVVHWREVQQELDK